jgi:hypothetical protein
MKLRLLVIVSLLLTLLPGCLFNVGRVKPETQDKFNSASQRDQRTNLITAPGQKVSISNTPAPIEGTIPKEVPQPIKPVTPNVVDIKNPPEPNLPTTKDEQSAKPNEIFPDWLREKKQASPDTPLLSSMRAFQDGRSDFGIEQLRTFSPMNQAILAKLLPSAARVAVSDLNDKIEATNLVANAEAAAEIARPYAELRIDTMKNCARAIDFGVLHKPFSKNDILRTGQFFELYYELSNTVPEIVNNEDSEQIFVLSFRIAVRIKGVNGALIKETTGSRRRTTGRPIHDVYDAIRLQAPETPGIYALELEVSDTLGRRAKKSLEFRVEERK